MGRSRDQRKSNSANQRTRSGAKKGSGRSGSRGVSITQAAPVGNISGSRPMVQATVKHSEITLSRSDIRVRLDGEAIERFHYGRSSGSLSFTPAKLSSGTHRVEIDASVEGAGSARKSWSFVVK